METIPTAKNLIKAIDVVYVNKLSDQEIADLAFAMRQYAKSHVQNALQEAVNRIEYSTCYDSLFNYTQVVIDQQSILGCYPTENIR